MLKRVRLNIHSDIDNLDAVGLPEGEREKSDESYTASLLLQGGEYRISYSAETEGGRLTTDITVTENGEVTVARRGAIQSLLVFREGGEFDTVYTVPPYKFDMHVKTQRLRIALSDKGGSLDILYLMTVGGASKRCRMRILAEESTL